MKDRGASDLHMIIGFPPMLRLRGELTPINHSILTAESNRELLFEMLTEINNPLWKAVVTSIWLMN
jgi:twitching motility protein PilT